MSPGGPGCQERQRAQGTLDGETRHRPLPSQTDVRVFGETTLLDCFDRASQARNLSRRGVLVIDTFGMRSLNQGDCFRQGLPAAFSILSLNR